MAWRFQGRSGRSGTRRAVERPEEAGVGDRGPGLVALRGRGQDPGVLHPDDLGPEVGQQHGGVGAGPDRRQVERSGSPVRRRTGRDAGRRRRRSLAAVEPARPAASGHSSSRSWYRPDQGRAGAATIRPRRSGTAGREGRRRPLPGRRCAPRSPAGGGGRPRAPRWRSSRRPAASRPLGRRPSPRPGSERAATGTAAASIASLVSPRSKASGRAKASRRSSSSRTSSISPSCCGVDIIDM